MSHRRALLAGFLAIASLLLSMLAAPAAARPAPLLPAPRPAAAPAVCSSGSGTATISGTVRGPGAAPANNATVEVYTTSGSRVAYESTDAAGVYSVGGLVGGTYLVRFNPQYVAGALLDEWYNNATDQTGATPVTVVDGGAATGIDATLEPGARISGQVTAADTSAPLQSVLVIIYDAAGDLVASDYTDAGGAYETSPGLRSGSYKVYFNASGGTPYMSEYYADKATLESANAVPVIAPSTVSGINAALAPGARISGRVTDAETGNGLPSMQVTIYGDDGYIDADYTDSSGNYTTSAGLASGTYTLRFSALFDTSDYIVQEKTVTVTAPNLTSGVDVALQKGGRITGRVTDGDGNPLQNITVFVADERNDYQDYVYTNASGVYTAYGLPSDNYIVFFRPSEYLSEHYNNKPDRQSADRIPVVAPSVVSGIDATLEKGGAISGRVTASDTGLGLSDVWVEIYDLSGDRIETAYTNTTGEYSIDPVLPAGVYIVKFIPNDNGASCGYTTEFYNDKASFETADLVTVAPPSALTNINAVLQPGGSISGRVTSAGGAGVDNVYVQVYDNMGERVADGRTNAAGTYFTTPALPDGSYRVGFFPRNDNPARYLQEYYNDKPTLALSDPIAVSATAGASNIDAVLAQGGAISGRVTAADTGTPLQYVFVSVYDGAGEQVAYGRTDADGRYTTSAVPSGNYRVEFDPSDRLGGYLGSFYNGAASLADADPIAVGAPSITANIDAALARGATISGRVTAADTTAPLENIGVTIYDSSGDEVSQVSTDSTGAYTSGGLRPGAYRVQFNPYSATGYAMEFYNNKTSLAAADSVAVGSANVAGIDGALDKGGRISGRVTDASSGVALPGVEVRVYDSSGAEVADGYTGSTGSYVTVPALPSGNYRVRFVTNDYGLYGAYLAEFYNDKRTLAAADLVQITAPAERSGVDAALTKGGQITGRVLALAGATQSGEPAGQPGVEVTVYDSAGVEVAEGETNELGVYVTRPGLPDGTYRVKFTPPAQSGYGPTFYRGKFTLATADPVQISGAATRSGIDDTLLPVRSLFLPMMGR